jgi:polyhydroxyalkanoate synthesis regulator phasin
MSARDDEPSESLPPGGQPPDSGVADSVRAAVERTMRATAGSAVSTRERAADLVDDVVRRGRDARDELARRGQEAGAELARRGQEATGEVGRRLEVLERRLAELEGRLGTEPRVEVEDEAREGADPQSKAEG